MSSSTRKSSSSSDDVGNKVVTKRDDDDNDNNNNNNNINDDESESSSSSLLLEDWISHTDVSFHHFSNDEATQIRQALLDWYYVHRRKLPWRGDPPPYDGSTAKNKDKDASTTKSYNNNINNNKTTTNNNNNIDDDDAPAPAPDPPKRTAYGIWVSEIMLQQTRVEAVIPYWLCWMEKFPTVHHLARATPEQANAQWAGLGFYRRARLLHQAAQHVVATTQDGKNHGGGDGDAELPQTVKELQAIPGIGPYTAAAIASMAFDVSVPVVDGNVCRVLARLRGIAHHIKAPILKDKVGWDLAAQIIQAGGGTHAGDVNQAMMELGATYCAPSGTGIDPNDPLKDFYWSTRLGAEYYQHVVLSSSSSSSSVASSVDKFIDNPPPTSVSSCPLCDHQRMVSILKDVENSMKDLVDRNDDNNKPSTADQARRCGHTVFPTASPKQSKREEILAVAVISMTAADGDTNDSDIYWLLVKRPKRGLLAGQWELPATCLWSSDDDKTEEKPISPNGKAKGTKRRKNQSSSSSKYVQDVFPHVKPKVRRVALQNLLDDVASNNAGMGDSIRAANLSNIGKSIEHIFSHVRHTMWIEHASITFANGPVPSPSEWRMSSTDREVRWMRESDMKLAGVTSGVKKILKAVQDERQAVKEKETAATVAAEKKRTFFQPKTKKRK